ncbi:ABC transporter permease [Ilumatobacter sp.]|uniref:ABC transporter permease n=1 Tax=Ilumatobacter sp. TaxID=1967498 RepID=UPI003B52DBB5
MTQIDGSVEAEEAAGAAAMGGAEAAPDPAGSSRRLGIGFWVSVVWLAVIVILALAAPSLSIKSPNVSFIVPGERPPYSPSSRHLFGTDQNARDQFSRVLYGARVSLTVGFSAIAFGMVVGGALGMIAGYFRGTVDRIISFVFLTLLSFPALVLAILITALLDRTLFTISAVIGILSIAPVGRVARATTISFADREFVLAAKSLGASHTRILVRELLPNVLIPMGAFALLGVAVAIVAEGSLAFLGLSVPSPQVSWGTIIVNASGTRDLQESFFMAGLPIAVLFATVLALNFAGDRLRSYFDVKEISL